MKQRHPRSLRGGLLAAGALALSTVLAQSPTPGVIAGDPLDQELPSADELPPGRTEQTTLFGTVIDIRDLGAGSSLYSDFETGGLEVMLQTEEGPARILFGPQWQMRNSGDQSAFHIGHVQHGQQMMVIGLTVPLSREEDTLLPPFEEIHPTFIAEEVEIEGRSMRTPVPEGEPRGETTVNPERVDVPPPTTEGQGSQEFEGEGAIDS